MTAQELMQRDAVTAKLIGRERFIATSLDFGRIYALYDSWNGKVIRSSGSPFNVQTAIEELYAREAAEMNA